MKLTINKEHFGKHSYSIFDFVYLGQNLPKGLEEDLSSMNVENLNNWLRDYEQR